MKLATVGTSWITERFLRAAQQTPGLEPYAVFSRDAKKAKEFGAPFGASAGYDSYEAMLNDPAVDVVYIGSPNGLHFSQMMAAIDAGKAVICEKPFVSTMEEFERVKQRVVEKHAFVFEAITNRYVPNIAPIREAIAKIAPLHIVKLDFSQFSSRYPDLQNGKLTNVFDPAYSGGALYDLGVYCAHLAVTLFGKPQEVNYYCNSEQYGIDTSGVAVLRYPNMVCSLVCSKDTHAPGVTEFQGENGYLTITGSLGRCAQVELSLRGETPVSVGLEQDDNPMVYEAQAIARAIESKDFDAVLTELEQSEAVIEILHKARRSAGITFAADCAGTEK